MAMGVGRAVPTANRVLTGLKAALNLAYRDGKAASNAEWARVKPFHKVDAPRIRYLSDTESTRLVNACPDDLRRLTMGALLTGARYGELIRVVAGDVDHTAGQLTIHVSKSRPRSIVLNEEGKRLFASLCAGRRRSDLLFTRADGDAWGKSHQHRPLGAACKAAGISPAVSFHILRHTYASRLAMKGVSMAVIALQIGDSEAITAKHYAHLSPGFVADQVRGALGELGIVPASNVAALPLGGGR